MPTRPDDDVDEDDILRVSKTIPNTDTMIAVDRANFDNDNTGISKTKAHLLRFGSVLGDLAIRIGAGRDRSPLNFVRANNKIAIFWRRWK